MSKDKKSGPKKGFIESLKESFGGFGDDSRVNKSTGLSKFFQAVGRGDVEQIAEFVQKQGVDPNSYHLSGMTALHKAVTSGQIASVKTLLDLGADPDIKARAMDGITPICFAVERGRVDMVQLLAGAGADIYGRRGSGSTYLHQAVEKDDAAMVRALLDTGLDPGTVDDAGVTPVEVAIARCRLKAVAELLKDDRVAGMVFSKNAVVFDAVAERNDTRLMKLFIDHGFPVNYRDPDGVTLLHVAALEGDYDLVKALVEKGADLDKASTRRGNTPLHAAASTAELMGGSNIVRFLIRHGADVQKCNHQGETPLHTALQTAMPSSGNITTLLSYIDDINTPTGEGGTALLLAVKGGAGWEIVQKLLEKGADVNARHRQSGETALHAAAAQGFLWGVEELLKRGADPQLRDASGRTALSYARARPPGLAREAVVGRLEEKLAGNRALRLQVKKNEGPAP